MGQYELEWFPPQPGHVAAFVPEPPRAALALNVLLVFTPPRAALTVLDELNPPRWACWADEKVAPWLPRKLDDASEEIALIVYLLLSLKSVLFMTRKRTSLPIVPSIESKRAQGKQKT